LSIPFISVDNLKKGKKEQKKKADKDPKKLKGDLLISYGQDVTDKK